jgi:hypothetical protein
MANSLIDKSTCLCRRLSGQVTLSLNCCYQGNALIDRVPGGWSANRKLAGSPIKEKSSFRIARHPAATREFGLETIEGLPVDIQLELGAKYLLRINRGANGREQI